MLLALVLAAWPTPQSVQIAGCAAAACSTRDDVRVCKCIPSEGEQRPGITVDGPAGRHLEWDVRSVLGDVSDFIVDASDLDANGAAELLVASRAAESNGVMIRTWELAIVDGADDGVTHAIAQDWGRDFEGPKHALLLTEWANDGDRVVFIGREYRYADGRLEPTDSPVRRRAFDATFERERLSAINASKDKTLPVRTFLAAGGTKPGVDAPPAKLSAVTVKGVTRDEQWLQLHLQSSSGELETLSGSVEGEVTLRLGDATRKRLYPLGYAPADAETWLLGRTARRAAGQVWLR